MSGPRRILFIRRDNIGDLVLTTPLIHAVRVRFPAAWIGFLGNSYNTPVLAEHPDVDEVFAYDKAKHVPGRSRLAVYLATAQLLWRLRALHIDLVILAGPWPQDHAAQLAAWIRPRAIRGFTMDGLPAAVTESVPYGDGALMHEVEDVYRLAHGLGAVSSPGPCIIAADAGEAARVRKALQAVSQSGDRIVALHLSARRKSQRWPAAYFASLALALHARWHVTLILLWAPGNASDPRHPGDDAKAAEVLSMMPAGIRCLAWPTHSLAQLSGALSACHLMVCADGGAMHMASGLDVPVVAMFGDSPVNRWRPWDSRSEVLQAQEGDVANLEVASVLRACERVLRPASRISIP